MKICLQSVFQLVFLILCCVLITVRESHGTFVPGRCLCPQTQDRIRGQPKELTVHLRSPSCDKDTVIVTLKRSNRAVCINPKSPMGKQLIRCWKRAHRMSKDTKVCLRRKRRGGQRQQTQQRSQRQSRKAPSLS